jgi:hypothetical protein
MYGFHLWFPLLSPILARIHSRTGAFGVIRKANGTAFVNGFLHLVIEFQIVAVDVEGEMRWMLTAPA